VNLLILDTPTPTGFVFFTLANGLFLLVAWLTFSYYRRKRRTDYRVALGVGLINALAIFTSFPFHWVWSLMGYYSSLP
jgi:hypothetical protein